MWKRGVPAHCPLLRITNRRIVTKIAIFLLLFCIAPINIAFASGGQANIRDSIQSTIYSFNVNIYLENMFGEFADFT